MFYNFQRKKLCSHLLVGGALIAAGLGVLSCSDKYDLDSDDNQPSNLNDIYDYLVEQGSYNNYVQLIRDLGESEVLSKTGSKTLFVADDAAFAKFFASNQWNVSSYDQLTTAQKKLLLYSSMVDNPFSTSMLATADGPVKGEVFRRTTSTTIYDTVLVVPSSDPEGVLPDNALFDEIKANHPNIVMLTDVPNRYVLHFTPKFMSANKVFTTDIDFLYNKWLGKNNRSEEDVYVNNAKVVEANIFCKNGFVHKLDEVLMPLDNMAEALRKCSRTKLYSSILERFATPIYIQGYTEAYNQNKGTNYDTVFYKAYFSDRSVGSSLSTNVAVDRDKNGNPFDGSLKYDPGWTGYFPEIQSKGSFPQMEEMGVMLVPTDEALEAWWNGEGGDDIRKFYAADGDDTKTGLRKTPVSVLDRLIRAGQYTSFCQTIPSNFANVLDNAQMKLGLTEEDIDSVILATNGAIYLTNKVFAPTEYSSVLSPSVIDTTSYSTISNAIKNMDYDAYLNSMVSRYTFLLPTSKAMMTYIDPLSYALSSPQVWEFSYDFSKTLSNRITVNVWNCTVDENGNLDIDKSSGKAVATLQNGTNNQYIKDRLEDILDNMIVTQEYTPGKQYYKTKGNNFVRITPAGGNYNVYGSWQQQYNKPIVVEGDSVYTKKNGFTYIVPEVPMGASKSVAQTLADHSEEFSDFLWVLQNSGALSKNNAKDKWTACDQDFGNLFNLKDAGSIGAEDTKSGQKATYLLNNFHYTIYAPTNDAMQQAFAAGLPGPDQLAAAEEWDRSVAEDPNEKADSAAKIQEVLLDFVKYHIQDNAIFVDAGFNSGEYESGKTELRRSENIIEASATQTIRRGEDNTHVIVTDQTGRETTYETRDQAANPGVLTWTNGEITAAQVFTGKYSPARPYKLKVNVSASGMTVTDVMGNVRHVNTDDKLHNLMAREYWIGANVTSMTTYRPYQQELNNSSFAVIQAIDGPLFFDSENQFNYTRKQLTTEAKRRR